MRTANPALNDKTFREFEVEELAPDEREEGGEAAAPSPDRMTIEGTVTRTGFLLILLLLGATWVWRMFFIAAESGGGDQKALEAAVQTIMPWFIGGLAGGFVLAMITIFVPKASPVLAPIYVILEGFALGGLSAIAESQYPGIAVQAVGLTTGTLFALLFAYKAGLIKATENFRAGVLAATGAIFLLYIVTLALRFFAGFQMPYIHDSGPIGIGLSVFIVIVAALNLVLDFDFIEKGAQAKAPKYMEWYAAFGLMVTLVWLYVEILRLLAKLRSRD